MRRRATASFASEVFEDTEEETETVLSHLTYLDASGIAALNDWLDEEVL